MSLLEYKIRIYNAKKHYAIQKINRGRKNDKEKIKKENRKAEKGY